MNAILCVPPPNTVDHPLLGVASLAGILRAKGHEVTIFDLNALFKHRGILSDRHCHKEGDAAWTDLGFLHAIRPIVTSLLDELFTSVSAQIDFFGIHTPSASRLLAEIIAAYARQCLPHCKIIAGGPEFFYLPKAAFSNIPFDAIFAGEAEFSLIQWIEAGFPKGVFHAPALELDNLPFPDFNGFPCTGYSRSGVLPAETSRGCVNRCVFCDDARMWHRYRAKSPDRLRLDLIHLQKNGAKQVTFSDSVLNPTPQRLKNFLTVMKEAGIPWDGMLQARGCDQTLVDQMAQSGCRQVFIGIESFSAPFLERLNKHRVSVNGEQVVKAIGASDIDVTIGLIVAGPPLQMRSEFEHDLEVLADIAPYLAGVAVNPLCIPIGTALWHQGASFGLQGLEGKQAWRFWHRGRGLEDIRLRIAWCREAIDTLRSLDVSAGANYVNFEQYAQDQLKDAEDYFR